LSVLLTHSKGSDLRKPADTLPEFGTENVGNDWDRASRNV